MGKVEELDDLISTKHNEWKELSIRAIAKVSGYKKWVAEAVKKLYKKDDNETENKTSDKITKSNQKQPPLVEGLPTPPTGFIDDPNELLMSCAKRELNKESPDVRWGTILVNILKETKQLEAVNNERDEIQSKLKQYSTTDLISLRKKLTGNLLEDG